jgi:hypothetical protein
MRPRNPKIDPEAPASRIAALWGTNSAFARAIGRTPSTTQRWLEAGAVPSEYHEDIVRAAKRDGKRIKPQDFVDQRIFAAPKAAPTEVAA